MKTRIASNDAPAAIGPYSQAIKTRDFLFASGQLPVDPATGKIVAGGIREQFARVVENVRAVLAEGGCTFENVVKTTVFLKDMGDFAAMNEIYAKHFDFEAKPARSTVQVAKLPMDAAVEMEVIALV